MQANPLNPITYGRFYRGLEAKPKLAYPLRKIAKIFSFEVARSEKALKFDLFQKFKIKNLNFSKDELQAPFFSLFLILNTQYVNSF